ncbi:unnamed protein product, partial [Medioppia subpectinata]
INNTNVWTYHLWLDPEELYSVKWNINARNESVEFLCEVRTRGWLGFGLSPNGGMKSSDLVIAWVDDRTGDRYATGESVPLIDPHQDWYLLDSGQNSTHTIVHFVRPLRTCDTDHDLDITRDTVRLIYAYGNTDPTTAVDITKHGHSQRGSRSALLLSQPKSADTEPQESDLKRLVFNLKNVTIPAKKTTYWCKIFQLPRELMHVVKFDPYLTPGNEPFTHHISVYECAHPNPQALAKYANSAGHDCTDSASMPADYQHCFVPHLMWAVGAGSFNLPADVAFPMGSAGAEPRYVMINMHYDNPDRVAGRLDSSGIEVFYTQQHRKYEAFTLGIGSPLDDRIFIPPGQSAFHITGHCHTKCFENYMDHDGLKVFAIWPHAHLLATKLKIRHFRDGEELPWLEFDQNYDFNLQSFRVLKPIRKIIFGDQLTVECEYGSGHKNRTTMGGYATTDEMCTAWLYYYPKMAKSKPCFSGLTDDNRRRVAGVTDPAARKLVGKQLTNYLAAKQDWDQTHLDQSYNIMLNLTQSLECYWYKTGDEYEGPVGYPPIERVFKPPALESCLAIDVYTKHSIIVSLISLVSVVVAITIAVYMVYKHRHRFQDPPRNRLV